jgi:hypothetical protein
MKKFLTISILFLSSAVLWAHNGTYFFTNGNDGGAFQTVKKDNASSFLALQDASMNFEFTRVNVGGNVNFGIYTFDSDLNITSQQVWNDIGSSIGEQFTSDAIKSGEMVGFWVEVDGNKFYSVDRMNSNGLDSFGTKINHGQLTVGYEANADGFQNINKSEITVTITAVAPAAPSGQPLPGIMATIFISLPFIGFGLRKRLSA